MRYTLAIALAAALPLTVMAQASPDVGHVSGLAIALAKAGSADPLRVTSPAFSAGGNIPLENTQYGANRFPGLRWSPGPRGTVSYAVIMQGESSPTSRPNGQAGLTSIHFTAVNLPGNATSLPAGIVKLPANASYGPNVHGLGQPYAGPHAHTSEQQPYHFQVFALDTKLAGDPSLTYDKAIAAMQGHVLASGELVGMSSKPAAEAYAKAVPTEAGLVSGVPARDPAVTVYKGIPYAAAPVGALRWRAPAPAPAWKGVRKADQFGHTCPQPAESEAAAQAMSEDCLTLNVWTGAQPESKPRPVLVWIYPGGFIQGSGSDPLFDGEGLARKGVVVVTFNYRLGALGFLSTPELSRESGHRASGNYGLLDDIAVLKWVQRNIAAFGGDPKQVTIAGESAGAGSVGFLALSPLAKGLFKRAIAESHARDPRDPELRYLSVSYRQLKPAEEAGVRFVEAKGTRDLAALRALPWQQIVEGSNTIDTSIDTLSTAKPPLFRPVIDGWVLPKTYSATFAARAQNKVVFVAGSNRDETGAVPETAFAALRARTGPGRPGMPQVNVTLDAFRNSAHAKFGPLAEEFLKLYPASNDEEAALASNEAARDNSRISTWSWARDWAKGAGQPVYTYFWTHAPPGPDALMRGAYHGSEINYALGNLYATDRPWTDEDRRIADTMSSYWANIVKTGNPNGAGLPEWPAYDAKASTVMRLGEDWGMIPIATPERTGFWLRFFATQKPW